MAQDIWLNLPVKDLARSITFFTEIGFARNPEPGNSEQSASFTIGEKKVILMCWRRLKIDHLYRLKIDQAL